MRAIILRQVIIINENLHGLWGEIMDWAGGDISKVNIDPKHKDRLYKKWSGKTWHWPNNF